MRIELLIANDCLPCQKAEEVWRGLSEERGLTLSVVDVHGSKGKRLSDYLSLTTVPALMIDGSLVAVGVQDRDQASELLSRAGLIKTGP